MAAAALSLAIAKLPSIGGLLGGHKGESYSNVMDESINAAANAGDWTRVLAVSQGGRTAGMPYNNSDGHGGWSANQPMDWGQPGYETQVAFAKQLVMAHFGTLSPNITASQVPGASSVAAAASAQATSNGNDIQAAINRALAAGESELATRASLELSGAAASTAASARSATVREQSASVVPFLSASQGGILIIVAVVVVLFFALKHK